MKPPPAPVTFDKKLFEKLLASLTLEQLFEMQDLLTIETIRKKLGRRPQPLAPGRRT